MVFRLPTHLDSFVPPPSQQAPDQKPWRGTLSVNGIRISDRDSSQTVRVTAVETDGDNRAEIWPSQFYTQVIQRPVLRDLQTWVKRHALPLCTFMPDRHRDPGINAVNQATFRSLSRLLSENRTVAVASWGSDDIPGAGIIIFPTHNSSYLLLGALFLTNSFPEFITGTPSTSTLLSPALLQPTYRPTLQQSIPSYVASSRHHHSMSTPQVPYSTHLVGDLGSADGQRHFYPMPRTYSTDVAPLLSSASVWADDENEDGRYPTTFSATQDSRDPRSG